MASATRLCDAAIGSMVRFDGHLLTLLVLSNASTGEREAASRVFPTAPTGRGRAILERRIIHHPRGSTPRRLFSSPLLGYRTVLAVPLLREGGPIGALVMWRRDVAGPSPRSRSTLFMTTFADQAVIAPRGHGAGSTNRDLTEAGKKNGHQRNPAGHIPARPPTR